MQIKDNKKFHYNCVVKRLHQQLNCISINENIKKISTSLGPEGKYISNSPRVSSQEEFVSMDRVV